MSTLCAVHNNILESWPVTDAIVMRDNGDLADEFFDGNVDAALKPVNELHAAGYLAMGRYTCESSFGEMDEIVLWFLTPKGMQRALWLRSLSAQRRAALEAASVTELSAGD